MKIVRIQAKPALKASAPSVLFEADFAPLSGVPNYAIFDAKPHFSIVKKDPDFNFPKVSLIMDWFSELRMSMVFAICWERFACCPVRSESSTRGSIYQAREPLMTFRI